MTIKNFNTTVILDASGRWVVNFPNSMHDVKVAVVRQIMYNSNNATRALFQIRSSLSHDLLGTVDNNNIGFVSNPQTRIKISNPNISYIEFVVTSPMLPIASVATDQISIDMDFFSDEDLKYI